MRKACAIVLRNFKPSGQLYDEEHGESNNEHPKRPLDYAAVKKAVREEMEAALPPIRKSKTHTHIGSSKVERDASLRDLDPAKFRYKPSTATEDLFKKEDYRQMQVQRHAVAQRAELLMSTSLEQPKVVTTSAVRPHAQTVSLPLRTSVIVPDAAQHQRPKAEDQRPPLVLKNR